VGKKTRLGRGRVCREEAEEGAAGLVGLPFSLGRPNQPSPRGGGGVTLNGKKDLANGRAAVGSKTRETRIGTAVIVTEREKRLADDLKAFIILEGDQRARSI